MRTLVIFVAAFTIGCTTADPPTAKPHAAISPLAAKRAIVQLVRDHRGTFIGNPDPERLDAIPLTDMGDGKWSFGIFQFSIIDHTYAAFVGADSMEPYLYEGDLEMQDLTVVATTPRLTRMHVDPAEAP